MASPQQTEHATAEDLDLYLTDRLSDEAVSLLEAHLEGCPSCAEQLGDQDKCLWYMAEVTAGNGDPIEGERRRHPRLTTDDPATLQVLLPFSSGRWEVRIIDVSKEGLRAHTPKGLEPGSLIRIRMKYSVACGDVRYCIPADGGFYAGVRLHDYLAAHLG